MTPRGIDRRIGWTFAIPALLAIAGCATFLHRAAGADAPAPREPHWEEALAPRIPQSPELAARGREIFESRCAGCHGLRGDGNGPAAPLMQPRPRDLTSGVFKFRSTPEETMPTDEDLFRTVSAGFPQYGMPSFRYLSAEDRWALVYFVKSLSPEWARSPAGKPVDVGEQPAGADLERGEQLFRKLKCTDCHVGPKGEEPRFRDLKDDWGRPIHARALAKGPLYFKSGGRPRDVARVLLTGIPGTPMGSFANEIKSREDLWALASFVESMAARGARAEEAAP